MEQNSSFSISSSVATRSSVQHVRRIRGRSRKKWHDQVKQILMSGKTMLVWPWGVLRSEKFLHDEQIKNFGSQ